MSLPGFALVTPLVLSQGEEGGVLTYVPTRLCACDSTDLCAR